VSRAKDSLDQRACISMLALGPERALPIVEQNVVAAVEGSRPAEDADAAAETNPYRRNVFHSEYPLDAGVVRFARTACEMVRLR
jgi:hypothetical protein